MTPLHNHGQDNGNLLVGCTCDEPWSGFALAQVIPPPPRMTRDELVNYARSPQARQATDFARAQISRQAEGCPPLPWYERYRAIYRAVCALTARCDGARDEDGVGWNKEDAYPMHDLADTPIAQWTMADFTRAWHALYKYRNTQLPFIGVDYAKLPRPVAPSAGTFSASSLH